MFNPRISAVISVKNRSHYLKECLSSLQAQTLTNWECIIVDDHSEEDLESLVISFKEPRFRYYRNPGKPGISSARNFGNSKALAEWIAVVDSDDINLPQRFSRSLEYLGQHPEADVFYGNIHIFDEENSTFKAGKAWADYDRNLLYERDFIPHPVSVYRKSVVLPIGYNEELPRCVDYDLWLSLADRHISFCYTDEALVIYRMHAEQTEKIFTEKVQGKTLDEVVRQAHLQFR